MTSLRDRVLQGEPVCVHGLGYIGASCASFLAARGLRVIGIDPDGAKIAAARDGVCPVPDLAPWLEAAGAPFRRIAAHAALARGTVQTDPLPIAAHHVAVPTEAEGAASDRALHDVTAAISAYDPDAIVIVESTVTPPYLDEARARHPNLRFAAAPRRDWFDATDKHMGNLPRIVGCDDPGLRDEVIAYLSLVCEQLIATSLHEAALTKIIENGLRQLEIAYANELALRLGDRYDVRRILELAATKWNIGLFRPSIGVGGYCLPLAPLYLQTLSGDLSLTDQAIATARLHIDRIVKFLARFREVHFWTARYKATAPFMRSAPSVWIAERLRDQGVKVALFSADAREAEWAEKAKIRHLPWPEAAGGEVLVIPVAHADAKALTYETAQRTVCRYPVVVDNEDVLHPLRPVLQGIDVRVPGRRGWLA